ncbi:hypothetical protein RJ639_001185 [Escallonia herrerae]|uniref:POS2 n=1 Tax=Escallonia herrerae TaxID=1293975 RepID=A0AA88XR55_9ASTE|nr:hypothetical protein RJ639_001185 [Escallonia herrerae]
MHSTNTNEYHKFSSASPPPTAPYREPPTTGVPVSSSGSFYGPDSNPPLSIEVQQRPKVAWSTGLCDCFSDTRNCCITCWCPCITFGQIAEMVDKGSSACGSNGALYALIACVTGCACFYSCFYRAKMRQQYSLHEVPCGDCLVHCCCETCALCQEYRELKNRGFDMTIGWHGNMERQTRGVEMAPVIEEGMSR